MKINVAAGYVGGSEAARTQLFDAASSRDMQFNLVAVDSKEVGFASTDGGSQTRNNVTGEQEGADKYTISIDFKDYDRLGGSDEAKRAYSVGIGVMHEIAHNLYGPTSDKPNGDRDPGPVENRYINPIRKQLGLPERDHYRGKVVPGMKDLRQVTFGKNKILRWRHDQVGGVER